MLGPCCKVCGNPWVEQLGLTIYYEWLCFSCIRWWWMEERKHA